MNLFLFIWLILPLGLAEVTNTLFDEVLPDRWIVVLNPNTTHTPFSFLSGLSQRLPGDVNHTNVYHWDGFSGFAASMSSSVAELLLGADEVAYIEPDRTYQTMSRFSKRSNADEPNAPWGLARISHRNPGSTDYVYDTSAGEGTCVYVLDTGINAQHVDFGGRATNLAVLVGPNTDDNGHGTHVAGTIGGATYGVAKLAQLFSIKVLDSTGVGSVSTAIDGVQIALVDALTRASCAGRTVACMSFGGSKSTALNAAVSAAIDAGLFFAVAAGNGGIDLSEISPASAAGAFAAGATDSDDNAASFSNFGAGLGVWAPGVGVTSAWIGSDTATLTLDGTSMANAHVAGLAAYLLGLDGAMAPSTLSDKIKGLATCGVIEGDYGASVGTIDCIAYNGIP